MMKPQPSGLRILIMRPQEAALRTAERLQEMGHHAIVAPILRIVPTNSPLPGGVFDAISVTSAASVKALAALPDIMKSLPVLAVGERTAMQMQEKGFTQVYAAEGERHSMAQLARMLFASRKGMRVLLALGRDHKSDTAALLKEAGLEPVPWINYAAEALLSLPKIACDALSEGTVDVVLHYSRRSAEIAIERIISKNLWDEFICLPQLVLSEEVAIPLRERGVHKILVAGRPHEEALLELLSEVHVFQCSP